MDGRTLSMFLLVLIPIFIGAWTSSREDRRDPRDLRRGIHYHSKRHMLPNEPELKRRTTTQRPREIRKKPSGHLKPLDDDDMDNDEVISVAIGPPPIRPKYDKVNWKHVAKPANKTTYNNLTAANLVKDVLTQLGREFIYRQVNEDFVFGQYVGNAMKNLTCDLRLSMQHEILELVVKYQKLTRGEGTAKGEEKNSVQVLKELKMERKLTVNDTEETWPDFTNLAKIVG